MYEKIRGKETNYTVEQFARYKSLAKKADERLRQLERMAEREEYKGVKSYAYKKAMRDIRKMRGAGATRFGEAKPKNLRQLKARQAKIENFLAAPSSEVSKIKEIYEKRVESLNNSQGTNFTYEDYANYWENVNSGKIIYSRDSLRAMSVINDENRIHEKLVEEINKANENIKNDVTDLEINKRMKELGLTDKSDLTSMEKIAYKKLKQKGF